MPDREPADLASRAISATNLALNPSRSGFPHPLDSDPGWGGGTDTWDIVDGRTYYPYWAEGLAFNFGGTRQLTIDFGQPVSFDEAVIWHHGDCCAAGHSIPADVTLEYFDGSLWQPISFTRSYDLSFTPPPGNYGSYPDTYTFAAVTGSKMRWSFNGSGANVLGNASGWHGWVYEVEVLEASAALHIGDLDAATADFGDFWGAQVTALVQDAAGNRVAGAAVSFEATTNTGAGPFTLTCTTDASGTCSIRRRVPLIIASATVSVTDITRSGFVYDPAANMDADGDSDGTSIHVTQP